MVTAGFTEILYMLQQRGAQVSPRGQLTLELENFIYTLRPYKRFMNYPSRKLKLSYIKDELKWYLKGDPYDLSICEKASIWHDMVTDGAINSNYGYYIFRQGLIDYVVSCLERDPDSRRAIITILGDQHLHLDNRDVPCTTTMGFRLRDGRLNCTVHMRSQDAIFGMGNDVPFFSFVQECVLIYLNELRGYHPHYELGTLTVMVDSFHVYERHFKMIGQLVTETVEPVDCPELQEAKEINLLRKGTPDPAYPFTRWLYGETL